MQNIVADKNLKLPDRYRRRIKRIVPENKNTAFSLKTEKTLDNRQSINSNKIMPEVTKNTLRKDKGLRSSSLGVAKAKANAARKRLKGYSSRISVTRGIIIPAVKLPHTPPRAMTT